MASLTATEPAVCPGTISVSESIVPACMFAPDRVCADDPTGEGAFEDGEGTNGDSVDYLDLSSKVGLCVNYSWERYVFRLYRETPLLCRFCDAA